MDNKKVDSNLINKKIPTPLVNNQQAKKTSNPQGMNNNSSNLNVSKNLINKNNNQAIKKNDQSNGFSKVVNSVSDFFKQEQFVKIKDTIVTGLGKSNNATHGFIKKHHKIFELYKLIASISVFFVFMYVSVFLSSNIGYKVNGIWVYKDTPMLVSCIIFGVLCLLAYLPIMVLNIVEFIFILIKDKKDTILRFSLYVFLMTMYLMYFIMWICFGMLNYRLFYVLEIFLLFTTLVHVYLYLDNKYYIKLNFLEKINKHMILFDKKEKNSVNKKG